MQWIYLFYTSSLKALPLGKITDFPQFNIIDDLLFIQVLTMDDETKPEK